MTKGKAKMHLFMMRPPKPSVSIAKTDNINVINESHSEKSHVEETIDDLYSNANASKNIR